MPVVVTGGDEPLGRAVLDALRPGGGELRAVVATRAGQRALVPTGVRAALVDLADEDALAAVLTGAHTVVHVAGPEPAVTLGPVLAAAGRAGVALVVVVSAVAQPRRGIVVVRPGSDAVAQVVAADDRPRAG